MGGEPRESALDRPPLGLDLEAALVRVFTGDVQLAAEVLGGPIDQAVGEVLIRPELLDLRVVEPGLQERSTGAVAVLDARGDDMDRNEQAEGVGDQEPLATLDLLAGVEAPGCGGDGVSGTDGLRVDQAGARLGIAAVSLAHPVPQCVVDALDGAVVVPPGEVPVHRWPISYVESRAAGCSSYPAASPWVWTDLGRAPRTIDAYARGLAEYLLVCERDGIDPVTANRLHVAAFVKDLSTRPNRRGTNVVALDSGAGLANATLQQRLVPVRLFYDYLIEGACGSPTRSAAVVTRPAGTSAVTSEAWFRV